MTDQQDKDDVTSVLSTVFTSNDFHTAKFSPYLRYGTVEGKKWGVAISSKDPPQYPNLILNKLDTQKLVQTKKLGRIDKAYVVFAVRDPAKVYSYLGHRDAEEPWQDLQEVRPILGRNSSLEFWILTPNLTGLVDDDPF